MVKCSECGEESKKDEWLVKAKGDIGRSKIGGKYLVACPKCGVVEGGC